MEKTFGLLGEKLGHSYSPQIHTLLGEVGGVSYNYNLFPTEPEDIEMTLNDENICGFNVTIPYKQTVLAFCTDISPEVLRIGAANTLVKRDGKLCAYNTDLDGFRHMVYTSGIKVSGKKVLVLGSGGASKAVCCALNDLAASSVVVISRNGNDNYDNLYKHQDAEIIVNTTPVGMYPNNLSAPVDLRAFPHLTGVLDLIYNPELTGLLLQAESLKIPHLGGLHMLVAQARASYELFTDIHIPDKSVNEIVEKIKSETRNIILIGMPGCGKTEIARALSESLNRELINIDTLIECHEGKSIPKIFEEDGEDHFRNLESEITSKVGTLSGKIISTGGGVVTRSKNYAPLHQNGLIIYVDRDINLLPRDGRPLSKDLDTLKEMYKTRKPMYEFFMDQKIENNGTLKSAVERIEKIMDTSNN